MIECRRADRAPLRLIYGYALARECGFVHGALAAYNSAVNGYTLARSDNENIALDNLFRRYDLLFAVSDYTRGFRCEIHKALYRVRRASLADGFEVLADGYERQYHRRRLIIEPVEVVHGGLNIAVYRRVTHLEEHCGAVYICRRAPEGDERIHIRRAVKKALGSADKKALIYDRHGSCQKELIKSYRKRVRGENFRQRPAPHQVSHGYIHQRQEQYCRGYESIKYFLRLTAFERRFFILFFAADILRCCAVARCGHGSAYFFGSGGRRKIDGH